MADSNAAFTALLEPWWDVFPSEYVVIHSKSDGVDLREHFYALELPLYEPTDDREATWRRYCEAMAIILLASPVDPTTYRWEIWEHCGIEEEYERQDYQLNMPSRLYVRLNDSIKYDLAWYLNAITTLLSPATERSDAISASRAALLEMAKEQQLGLEKVVIPVVVSLSFDDQKPIFPILERLIELQRRWLDDSAAGRSGMYLFYVERLELQVAWSFVSRGLVEAIEHYKASPGLQLHLIKHPPFAWMAPCSIVTKRTLLWRWAAATTGLPNASTVIPEDVLQASGVQLSGSHQLDVFGLTGESFPALFSSLMHSSDVHELVIRNSMLFPSIKDPSSKYKWCWLFYALFNEASSHSVTSLHIDDKDIVLEDLLTARDMTTSTDPLKMLINPEYDKLMNGSSLLSPTVELPPVQVTLRAGAQINIDPLQSPEGLIQTVQECTFDVVGQFRDGYGILVPGYGHCWVNHEDVTNKIKSSDDNSRNRWCFKTHSVKSLSISLNETHVEDDERGIKELLKLIGAPITQLTLTFSMGQALDQSYLDCVWTYCPRLDIFSFEYVEFDSLEGLIEVYASGRCRATVLSLPHCIIDDASSVIAFANALADPTTPIAMTLRQLRLTIIDHDEVDDMITHSTVCSFRDMLATNEHLDHLELWLSDDLYDVYEADFSDYDGEEMLLPLPLPAKCAFLSVVKHGQRHERKGSRDSTRALELIGRLDNLVISTIFQFAGESSLRSIALVAVSNGDDGSCGIIRAWWNAFGYDDITVHYEPTEHGRDQLRFALCLPLCTTKDDAVSLWKRRCEAIELFLLVSVVNPPVFAQLVWDKCSQYQVHSAEWLKFSARSQWGLRVELPNYIISKTHPTLHLKMLTILFSRRTNRSADFKTTYAAILELMGQEVGNWIIPVVVVPTWMSGDQAVTILRHITNIQRRLLENGLDDEETHAYRFVIDSAEVNLNNHWGFSFSADISGLMKEFIAAIENFKATPG